MPILTRLIPRGKLQVFYEVILMYLYSTPAYAEKIDLYNIGGVDVPCLARHSYTSEVVRWMTQEAELDDNAKGGEMYEFYLQLRPELMKDRVRLKWKDGKAPVKISERVLQGLIRLVKKHHLDKKIPGYRQLTAELMDLFADRKLRVRAGKPVDETMDLMNRHRILFRADRFPPSWINSVWRIYERTDVGICESYLSFARKGDLIATQMKTIYRHAKESTAFHYSGLSGRDEGNDHLVVQLFRLDQPYTYASLILRVDDYNLERQMACMAHYSYYAIRFRKYVTKQVILERTDFAPDRVPAAQEIYRTNLKEFQKINPFVRRYLFSRNHNRLSMPSQVITHLERGNNSLRAWINNRISPVEIDQRLKQCYGHYKLTYFDQQQQEHALLFDIEAEDKTMDVSYSKSIGSLKLSNLNYNGILRIASANILQGALDPVVENDERFIVGNTGAFLFVSIKLPVTQSPDAFREQFMNNPQFGLLSGLPDEVGNQPLCFRCVLTQVNATLTENIKKKLKNGSSFFSA